MIKSNSDKTTQKKALQDYKKVGTKYLDKTFNVFGKKIMNGDENSNIHDWIYQEMQNRLEEKDNSTATNEQQKKKLQES